ncbi:MAG TPA: DUF1156 domain-containing protein [Phycisphaerae bacterium]|nr:DUF1156 domain-containing protein [Phycisphaerae bacterium]
MPKRLIEVALPLKEVSEQSAREKSIRHRRISMLPIWWARRGVAPGEAGRSLADCSGRTTWLRRNNLPCGACRPVRGDEP